MVRLNTDRIRGLGWTCRPDLAAGLVRLHALHARRRPRGQALTLMRRAVFLDRDGVFNRVYLARRKTVPARRCSPICAFSPGVREACRNLREAGFA